MQDCKNMGTSGACQKTHDGAYDFGSVNQPTYDADGGLYVEFTVRARSSASATAVSVLHSISLPLP